MHGSAEQDRRRDDDYPGRPLSPTQAMQETLIVFDWDDTVLPTSWLDRIHALVTGGPLRQEAQAQVGALCAAAAKTINLAMTMGTVIFITNSAPGWMHQSCQLFMPQLNGLIRSMQICAKPLHVPVTFKINAFRRECQRFRNVVSIGDGDAERVACMRLQEGGKAGADGEAQRRVKSVKLVDLPTCQQLVLQHEMLQQRLRDIVGATTHLDLKVTMTGSRGPAGMLGPQAARGPACELVQATRQGQTPLQSPLHAAGLRAGASTAPAQARPQGEHDAATKAALAAMQAKTGPGGWQLPPLGTVSRNGPWSPGAEQDGRAPGEEGRDGRAGKPEWPARGEQWSPPRGQRLWSAEAPERSGGRSPYLSHGPRLSPAALPGASLRSKSGLSKRRAEA